MSPHHPNYNNCPQFSGYFFWRPFLVVTLFTEQQPSYTVHLHAPRKFLLYVTWGSCEPSPDRGIRGGGPPTGFDSDIRWWRRAQRVRCAQLVYFITFLHTFSTVQVENLLCILFPVYSTSWPWTRVTSPLRTLLGWISPSFKSNNLSVPDNVTTCCDFDHWPIYLNVYSVSAVTWSNYVPNFSKIKQSAAVLLQVHYFPFDQYFAIYLGAR